MDDRFGIVALLLIALALPVRAGGGAPSLPGEENPAARAAQESRKRDVKEFHLDEDGLALGGYDPVAYFPQGGGKPQKGKASISATQEGVTYRFASEANKKRFLAEPALYEPQYGGWCAYAMAQGKKVEIDPESFLVSEGKLYLFYKSFFDDTRAKWLKKPKELAPKADKAWKQILEPKPEKR